MREAKTIWNPISTNRPGRHKLFIEKYLRLGTTFERLLAAEINLSDNLSIEFAIMERAYSVLVIPENNIKIDVSKAKNKKANDSCILLIKIENETQQLLNRFIN
jgi:Mannose-1-phosphate guanylyltransferase